MRCLIGMSMHDGDFGAAMTADRRFSPATVSGHLIVATGVRRRSHATDRTEFCGGLRALRGRGAEIAGDGLAIVAVDEAGRQVQHDAPHRGLDSGTELHEMFSQRADLGERKAVRAARSRHSW